ncbi:coagulation factor XI-like [Mobula hypostoma]|uniref:coagulation factor XI-like n=1 Tax=Mobula hypostoma TaxID=723540 RepID=UPI002FC37E74
MSGFSLRNCEFNNIGCVHELAVNIDFPGNDIESVLTPDVNYCQKLCTEHKNCQFFTYLTRDWNTDQRRFYCYLKQNMEGEPSIKTELQNVVSGYSLKKCKTYNSCFKDLFVGLDFRGDDFRQFVVDDEYSCQRECTEKPDCQYFTFANGLFRNARQRYICYLKKSERGTPSKITTLENVVSGFLLRECEFDKSVSECRIDLSEDIDFPGNDITWVLAPDANVCQQLCTDHPQCLFFTFVKREWSVDHRRYYGSCIGFVMYFVTRIHIKLRCLLAWASISGISSWSATCPQGKER